MGGFFSFLSKKIIILNKINFLIRKKYKKNAAGLG